MGFDRFDRKRLRFGDAGAPRRRGVPHDAMARSRALRAGALIVLLLATPASGLGQEPGDAAGLRARARAAYDGGDYDRAIELLEAALQLAPQDTTLFQTLAQAHFAQGLARCESSGQVHYDEEAVRCLERALRYDGENAQIHAALGKIHLLGGALERARAELEAAHASSPEDPEPLSLLAEIAYRKGDLRAAREFWERAHRIDPRSGPGAGKRGRLEAERRVEEDFARSERQHFTLRFDADPAGIRPRADAALDALEEAYRELLRALDIAPEDPVPVVVYEDPDFREVTGVHPWAHGLYDGQVRLPARVLLADEETMRGVLAHEYTHAALHHATSGRCPVWLHEGLAQIYGGEWSAANAEVLESAERERRLVPLEALEGSFLEEPDAGRVRLYYYQSYAAARFLLDRWREPVLRAALGELREGRTMAEVLAGLYRLEYADLDAELARRIRWREFRAP